jgi:UDP-GlcNAc:undecaprenyl-phosphate GlcNAc-1-phosphate transferase
MAFSPFIVDASVTLIKRMIRRERIWEAHKSHYYQRLVQMGWGHRKTAMAEYIVMLAVGVSSLYASMLQAWMMMVVIIGWVIVYTVIMLKIDRVWAQRQR